MTALVIYPLLCASLFYLGSRAKITSFLWARYPPKFASFMDCAACTGFWWGFLLSLTLGFEYELDLVDLPAQSWPTFIVVGLCSIVWTPIIAALMQRGLDTLGTIEIADPDHGDSEYRNER